MSNKIILLSVIGIFIVIFALYKLRKPVVENWWDGIQFSTKNMPYTIQDGQEVALPAHHLTTSLLGKGQFVSVPNYKSVLPPRFSNTQYGAHIKYNMPDTKNQGVPCEPLTFGNMASETKENYSCSGNEGLKCGAEQPVDKYQVSPGYTSGNHQEVYDSLPKSEITSDLPIGTMSTLDGGDNPEQYIVYNRLMVANTKSRLRGLGDLIRGDLPIDHREHSDRQWFSVAPNISTDLHAGAMNVLAGAGGGGESYNKLMQLISHASGGTKTALGGVDLADPNLAGEHLVNLHPNTGDVQVTAFP
jgi:hypothetical protein